MKLISGRDPLPEEVMNAYPPKEARELVRHSLGEPEPVQGLEDLREGLLLDTDSQVLSRVESGEWLLVKDEAYTFDWGDFDKEVRQKQFDRRVLGLINSTPPQASLQIKYGQFFRVVNAETGDPLAFRKFIVTVGGEVSQGRTDFDGVASVYTKSEGMNLSIHVVFKSPVRQLIEVSEPVNNNPRFVTTLKTRRVGSDSLPVEISVDDRAMTREVILERLKASDVEFSERSAWDAVKGISPLTMDWEYFMIALHHAGRTFTCGNHGALQLDRILSEHLVKYGDIGYHFGIDCSGHIFEGRDIRLKGGSVNGFNSRVIGIVLLEDLTTPNEVGDLVDFGKGHMRDWGYATEDAIPDQQIKALKQLLDALQSVFAIEVLAGHREFPKQSKEGKICPGNSGLELVRSIRRERALGMP